MGGSGEGFGLSWGRFSGSGRDGFELSWVGLMFQAHELQGEKINACCHIISSPVNVLSCHVVSCHVLSCRLLSCPVLSSPVLSCPVMSSAVISTSDFGFPASWESAASGSQKISVPGEEKTQMTSSGIEPASFREESYEGKSFLTRLSWT